MSERIGTDAAETLPGSFGADLILGLGGNDLINGNAGSDTLAGNAGVDTVFGGLDNDFVLGGKENDLLYGDEGNDTIFGNKGDDAIEAGAGNDVIFGGKDNDVIEGGSGSDVIWGDLGADSLVGGSGADVFVLTPTSGGATVEEADTIADFVPGTDSIGLSDSIDTKSLNITFQAIANSSVQTNVILQDLSTGQFLAVIENVSRSEFLSNDNFTTILTSSQNVDINEVPGSETESVDTGSSTTVNTVTRDSVGKSAPLTTNTTIVTFENTDYAFSSSDFSFFDIDGDAFSEVRIASLPEQGDLFTSTTATDATTGVTSTTKTAIAANTTISASSLSSLLFVPDADTQGGNYASFTFQVSDGENLSNVGTAAIIVKDESLRTTGETNVSSPTIDSVIITTAATEPENGSNTTVALFSDIDLFDDSGNLTSVTVSLSGGSPETGEDVLSVTGLPSGITASTYDTTNRTLTLSGDASFDDYETAIKLIEYTNTVNTTSKSDRTVTVSINDGLNAAVSGDYTLSVAADDDAIELKNAETSTLTGTESADISSSNPIEVTIFADSSDGSLTFEDPDTAGSGTVDISSIDVSISSGFESGVDVLSSSGSANISFSAFTGNTLTLSPSSGSATSADYATALKTIQFTNDSDTPDTSTRQISIAINGESASIVRDIGITATNDVPTISSGVDKTETYTIGTTGNLDFTVSSLLTDVTATDRDHATSALGLQMTSVTDGGGGTWTYSNDGGSFAALGSSTTVANGGTLRFSGATSVSTAPGLTFTAWDGTGVSTNTADISVTVASAGTTYDSGAGNDTYDADTTGPVTIAYDALGDAEDTITNFDPTEDVIQLQGSDFGAGSSAWDNDVILDANTTFTSSEALEADIIFLKGNNSNLNTLLSSNTFQSSAIFVQRKNNGNTNDINVWYVEDGSTPATTQMASLGNLDTAGGPVLSGADADAKWQSFISNGADAFEVIVP